MSWLLDIAVLLIIGLTVYGGYKRGFVRTAISIFSFIIAIIITACFSDPLAGVLKESDIGESIEEFTEEKITNIMYDNSCKPNQLLAGENEDFNRLVEDSGFDMQEISDWYESQSHDADDEEDAAEILAEKLASPVVDTVVKILAIIILYVGSQIIVSVIGILLDNLMKLPFLRSFNKTFGIVLGVILAVIRISLFCFAINVILNNKEFINSDFIASLNSNDTILFNLFSKINIFSFFI